MKNIARMFMNSTAVLTLMPRAHRATQKYSPFMPCLCLCPPVPTVHLFLLLLLFVALPPRCLKAVKPQPVHSLDIPTQQSNNPTAFRQEPKTSALNNVFHAVGQVC